MSGLVWEVFRIFDDCHMEFMFLENVDNIRFMPDSWQVLLDALAERSLFFRWVSLVGCPQRRRRWFLLATRDEKCCLAAPLVSPGFAAGSPPDARLPYLKEQCGRLWNGGQPPPDKWMVAKDGYRQIQPRLKMLGNVVVPLQAHLAAILLSTQW